MNVVLVETSPQAFREEAEQLARRHGHATVEEMLSALDNGVYAGEFVEFEIRDLRNILEMLAGTQMIDHGKEKTSRED